MIEDLEHALLRFSEIDTNDLESQLGWLEEAATAAAAAEPELGEAGVAAATYLKAGLGAFVAYSQSQRTERDRLGLELSVRTMLTSALAILYGALSKNYFALSKVSRRKAQCRELSEIFTELERTTKQGKSPERGTLKRLAALQTQEAARK